MSRRLISSGSDFESKIGYSRAVVSGDWVFVAGTTGYDYSTGLISPDVGEQTHQTLLNIERALKEAGCGMEHIVRVHYILPNKSDFPLAWPVLQRWFGNVRPAATMIEAGLFDDDMKIEIEVTAHVLK